MLVWDGGVTTISLDLRRAALAGLRDEGHEVRRSGVIYTRGAHRWEQRHLIRDLSRPEPPRAQKRTGSPSRGASITDASMPPAPVCKITRFWAGLKGKCVRLNMPGLVPESVAWGGGGGGSIANQVPGAEASFILRANAELAQVGVSFLKAHCWFVQFNDFLRYFFSYLFPSPKAPGSLTFFF